MLRVSVYFHHYSPPLWGIVVYYFYCYHFYFTLSLSFFILPAELPKPSLGDLSDLKTLSVRQRRENNPNVLGYNYDELVSLDTVDVELVPEKKGIILKHNEYHITSKVRKRENAVNNDYYDFLFYSVFLFCF